MGDEGRPVEVMGHSQGLSYQSLPGWEGGRPPKGTKKGLLGGQQPTAPPQKKIKPWKHMKVYEEDRLAGSLRAATLEAAPLPPGRKGLARCAAVAAGDGRKWGDPVSATVALR